MRALDLHMPWTTWVHSIFVKFQLLTVKIMVDRAAIEEAQSDLAVVLQGM